MPYMSQAGKRELVLLARLFQEELGRLPCALVRYTRGNVEYSRMLRHISSPSTKSCINPAVRFFRPQIMEPVLISSLQPLSTIHSSNLILLDPYDLSILCRQSEQCPYTSNARTMQKMETQNLSGSSLGETILLF